MPSSGYGAVSLVNETDDYATQMRKYDNVRERAAVAMRYGLFAEWLESFLAAWEETHDADIASWAGIVEWDM